jgi:hypothetical protein
MARFCIKITSGVLLHLNSNEKSWSIAIVKVHKHGHRLLQSFPVAIAFVCLFLGKTLRAKLLLTYFYRVSLSCSTRDFTLFAACALVSLKSVRLFAICESHKSPDINRKAFSA